MNICLLYPYDKETAGDYDSEPHLGLAYIASSLIANGHNVEIYDCMEMNLSLSDLFNILSEKTFDAIGMATFYINHAFVFRTASFLKKKNKNTFIFIGGYLPTLNYKNMHRDFDYIDCMVIGEGEITTCKIIDGINDSSWKKTKGIVYLENGKLIYTGKCEAENNLDLLSFPLRTKPYRKEMRIITTRGCYGKCSYCSFYSMLESCNVKRIRRRSPENVVCEIEEIIQATKANCIRINDDNFALVSQKDREWFQRFNQLIQEKNINVKFHILMRADDILRTGHLLEEFKQIGLASIFVGIESFLQKHLDFYNKRIKVEENLKALAVLDDLNIAYEIGFLLYNPITTIDDILQTVRIIKDTELNKKNKNILRPISVSSVIAYHGTDLYEYTHKNNIFSKNRRGYIIQDEKAEACLEVMTYWSQKYDPIIEKRNLYTKAVQAENNSVIHEIKLINFKLFYLDIDFLEEVAKIIAQHNIEHFKQNKEFYLELVEQWALKVNDLYNEIIYLEKQL